jgi:hypothetical protein
MKADSSAFSPGHFYLIPTRTLTVQVGVPSGADLVEKKATAAVSFSLSAPGRWSGAGKPASVRSLVTHLAVLSLKESQPRDCATLTPEELVRRASGSLDMALDAVGAHLEQFTVIRPDLDDAGEGSPPVL